jgi:hypothetical protein
VTATDSMHSTFKWSSNKYLLNEAQRVTSHEQSQQPHSRTF